MFNTNDKASGTACRRAPEPGGGAAAAWPMRSPPPSCLQLLDQIFNLKFTSKQLVRAAKKCEKEEKDEKLKIKKAIEKGGWAGLRSPL